MTRKSRISRARPKEMFLYLLTSAAMMSHPPVLPPERKTMPMPSPLRMAPSTQAIESCPGPRICISVPTSPVQMEYVCGMKPKKILELVPAIVSYAKTLCPDVEFSCKDATRSEKEFLCKVILSAVKAGATLVDLEDTAGVMLPEEFDSLMDAILAMLKEEGENVELSVTCSDNLNMATANAVTCIRSGAVEVKTSLIGKTAPGLEAIVNMVTERGDSLEMEIAQKRPEVEKTLRKLFWMEGSRSGGTSVFEKEETKHEELDLDENADISKVIRAIRKLGYELSDDDNAKVYKEFKRVSEKKKVGAKEMEAIIATASLQVAPTYQLVNFVINSGNIITPTAQVTLEKDGNQLKGLSSGDGPIAAAFLAVEMVVGVHYELDDFQIQSVTEGSEAVGNALVKLRYNGKLYSGNGISTDIIGASIRAYLNAINKIVFDSKNE